METASTPTLPSPSPGVDTPQAADAPASPSAAPSPPGAVLSDEAQRVRDYLAAEGRVRGITRIARAAKLSRDDAQRVADELADTGVIERRKGKGRRYAIAGAPGVGTPATETAPSAPARRREGEPLRTDKAEATPATPVTTPADAAPITTGGLRVSALVGAVCAHTLPPALTDVERAMLDDAFPGLELPPWAQQAGVLLVVLGPRLQARLATQAAKKRQAAAKTPQQANQPAPKHAPKPEPKAEPAPAPKPAPEPAPKSEPEPGAMSADDFAGFEEVGHA